LNLMPEIINNSQGVLTSYFNWGTYKDVVYYIYGSLTIFGANNIIPSKNYITTVYTGERLYIALDQNKYGDIFLEDAFPDLAVGRIQGISISDVSSYIARDLFYDKMIKTNKIQFIAEALRPYFPYYYTEYDANEWAGIFKEIGYTVGCNMLDDSPFVPTPGRCIEDIDKSNWKELWKNNEMIYFLDHGGPYGAGILSTEIPQLSNSLIIIDACLTCSTYDSLSFCNNVIRKGGIGFMGTVSSGYSSDDTFRKATNGIYFENLTLGQSFSKAYTYDTYYMDTLIGDPTLDLNPMHTLSEQLP